MSCWRLAFVDEHRVESVGYLNDSGAGDNTELPPYRTQNIGTDLLFEGVRWVLPGRDCCLSTCPRASEWACQCWPLALTHKHTQMNILEPHCVYNVHVNTAKLDWEIIQSCYNQYFFINNWSNVNVSCIMCHSRTTNCSYTAIWAYHLCHSRPRSSNAVGRS